MFSFYMPKYKTPDEIMQERRWRIETSGAFNTKEALKWFDANPDIELDWVTINDIYEAIGIRPDEHDSSYGWLTPHGQKPDIYINGELLEDFKKKQSELMKGIIIKD